MSVGHKSGKLPPLTRAAAVVDTSFQLQRHLDVILEKEAGLKYAVTQFHTETSEREEGQLVGGDEESETKDVLFLSTASSH